MCGSSSPKYQRTFVVVFRPAEERRWWANFIDKKYGHCFLATYIDDKQCVVIDPSEGGIGFYVHQVPLIRKIWEYRKNGWETIIYTVVGEDMVRPRMKFFRTCVGICKDFLGVDAWWIITPKQLYKEVSKCLFCSEATK